MLLLGQRGEEEALVRLAALQDQAGVPQAAVGDAPDTFTAAPSRVVEGEPLGRSAVKLGGVRSGGEGGARSRLRVPLAVRVVGGVEGVANDQLRVEAAGLVVVAAVGVATCENRFGRISARFPPAVAHRLLLSSLTAAME